MIECVCVRNSIFEYSKTGSENGTGMNLLQCKVALVQVSIDGLVVCLYG